jgi:hypothetical protein
MVTATYTVSLATADGANPASWTDITAYVKSVTITRGRDDVLSQVQTGTATVSVVNDDGRFSPGKTSSPLYPHVATMRAIKVVATYSATSYPLYFGYIQSITPNLAVNVRDASIQLADGFAWLSIAHSTPTYSSVASGTSIGVALDSASWPAALRSLATGQSTFTPSYTDQPVLNQIQGIGIDNEGGLVYMDGQGRVVFQDRHTRLKSPYITSQGTLTDTGEIADMQASRPVADLANEVKVTHATGTVTTSDATSIAAKGLRRLDVQSTFITALEAADRAAWVLSTRKDDADRPSVAVVANASSTIMTQALARDLSDRVTITDASGLSGISGDYHIERIEHSIGNGGMLHTTRWQLSPANANSFWALDSGALDTTTRLAY